MLDKVIFNILRLELHADLFNLKWISMAEEKNNPLKYSNSFHSIFSWIENKPYQEYYGNRIFDKALPSEEIAYPKKIREQVAEEMQIEEFSEYEHLQNAIKTCKEKAAEGNSAIPYLLVSGDLSGIQDTVYTISSKGALKSLRARSFMLEFLCEHICYEIVTNTLGDYKTYKNHVVFTGGGGFCLLLPNTHENKKAIDKFKQIINEWAFEEFGGKLYIASSHTELADNEVALSESNKLFREKWNSLGDELELDKKRKFDWKLNDIFSDSYVKEPTLRNNAQECQICHRDDIDFENEPMRTFSGDVLNNIKKLEAAEASPDNPIIHELCYQLLKLGDKLTKAKYISRIKTKPTTDGYLFFPSIQDKTVYYKAEEKETIECIWAINNEEKKIIPFYYANYATRYKDLPDTVKEIEKTENNDINDFHTASFNALANCSRGASLISCLRMDVDNMGKILAEDLTVFNLATLANFSKMLNIFFKVYLPLICEGKLGVVGGATNITSKNYSKGRKVSIVYSGGDDLFIVGAWDETAELAYDIQKCFKEYSGLGISAGLTLHKPNFPLYQMAKQSSEALNESKNFKLWHDYKPAKNCFSLFYKASKKHKSKELNESASRLLKENRFGVHDGLNNSLEWNDDSIIKIVSEFNKICVIEDNKLRLQGVSKTFLRKLFSIVKVWWTRNIIYVPDLLRLFDEKINKLDNKNTTKQILINLRDMIIRMPLQNNAHKAIRILLIPLTWIELLQREKRGGNDI